MTRSRIFELTDAAAAALSRHESEIHSAPDEVKARARSLALDHLESIFASMILADERAAESRRIDAEHRAQLERDRVARIVESFKNASVNGIDEQINFFVNTLGASIVTLDAAGNVGNGEAIRRADAAVTMVKVSKRTDYHIQLPAGYVAIKAADPVTWESLAHRWSFQPSLSWTVDGVMYAVYSGKLDRRIDCDGISFSTSCRCGRDADWIVMPSGVQLDDTGRLPSLPDAVADAVASCAVGAERLLFSFLTK